MNRTGRFFIPALLWFVLSFILLILPGSILPKENWLHRIWADKWVHIILFSVLVVLWIRALRDLKPDKIGKRRIFLLLALFGIVYGIIMEFVQEYFISNRSFDIGDIAADTIGCLAGVVYGLRKYIKK